MPNHTLLVCVGVNYLVGHGLKIRKNQLTCDNSAPLGTRNTPIIVTIKQTITTTLSKAYRIPPNLKAKIKV